jgi:4-carboxymuconolactone decarboxylase
MARIPYVDPESASPAMREALEVVPPLNVFRMLAHAESAFWPYVDYNAVLLAGLDLDPILRELAILRVAALDRCEYERVHHEGIARKVGASDEQVAVAVDPGGAGDRIEGLVYRLAAEIVADNAGSAETAAELNAALGPRQLVELVMAITHYHGLAALAATVDMELDDPDGLSVLTGAEGGWKRSGRSPADSD